MYRRTPRCFTWKGEYSNYLCIGNNDCLISSEPRDDMACYKETACESFFKFDGPPIENWVLEHDIAIYDGHNAYLIKKDAEVTLIRYRSHMAATYVTTGDHIEKKTVIAGLMSRKGTFRKTRPGVEGLVLLVVANPLGKSDEYVVVVDERGVSIKVECKTRS